MQDLIGLTMMFKSCPNSKTKQKTKEEEEEEEEEEETFEGLLSLVFWKRVALNHDAQLEVRILVVL
jgi:hypothetical protein